MDDRINHTFRWDDVPPEIFRFQQSARREVCIAVSESCDIIVKETGSIFKKR